MSAPLGLHTQLYANQQQTSDTATPAALVPIFFVHTWDRPFCDNPSCECQLHQWVVKRYFHQTARGSVRMQKIDLAEQKNMCETFDHELVTTVDAGIKACVVCCTHFYCPGCTPEKPSPSAIPLFCTQHTRSNQHGDA